MRFQPSLIHYGMFGLAATMVATGVLASPILAPLSPVPQAMIDADFTALHPATGVNRTRKSDKLPVARETPRVPTITILRGGIVPPDQPVPGVINPSSARTIDV